MPCLLLLLLLPPPRPPTPGLRNGGRTAIDKHEHGSRNVAIRAWRTGAAVAGHAGCFIVAATPFYACVLEQHYNHSVHDSRTLSNFGCEFPIVSLLCIVTFYLLEYHRRACGFRKSTLGRRSVTPPSHPHLHRQRTLSSCHAQDHSDERTLGKRGQANRGCLQRIPWRRRLRFRVWRECWESTRHRLLSS